MTIDQFDPVFKLELSDMCGTARSETMCDRLIGAGPSSQGVYDLIRRVSDLDAFILITGESGTGKELVARAIHNLSHRSAAPFVAVSCGAIPETLLEAELFGNERGAYTGSVGSREGYFEQAGRGTLFLDEIGELSLLAQVKLLRVLQQREFSKLGSSRVIPMKARVLFATHRNLAQMVADGQFRSDLYYRVNVMQIQVPALRQRSEDIPLLANHFLEKYALEYGKTVERIHPSAMSRLLNYDWPGNIRELENAIARGVIVTRDDCITAADLPDTLQQEKDLICIDLPISTINSFEEQLRQYKLKLANRAIMDCNGNKTLAARSMRISRAYLHRLVQGGSQDGGKAASGEFNVSANA
jgi:transcriptional regulator with PAS, ATPase and Fis domain